MKKTPPHSAAGLFQKLGSHPSHGSIIDCTMMMPWLA
jgi:hypothetical protein